MENPQKPAHKTLGDAIAQARHPACLDEVEAIGRVGSWAAELDGSKRLTWSAETHRIFGVPSASFSGASDEFFRRVHPDDASAVRAAVEAAIDGRAPYDIEHRIVADDGEVRNVRERAEIVRDADGRPIRMIGTTHDITERRQLELQLLHAQKMDAVGRLAGGVAHDLNNALTTIAGCIELALAALDDNHPARADVEEIRRAAARAESVTRKLLAVSRRQLVVETREFDLNDLIAALAGLLERSLGEDVTLRTDLCPALPRIVVDPGQVEQAVVNLMVNARDAMAAGGTLVLSTAVEAVDEAVARSHSLVRGGRFVVLSVRDTGQGLGPETQARIFEPFFTTKPVGKGTGLGLTMVSGTMKQSGGFVAVESQPGLGATFRLYFPAVGREEPLAADPATHPPAGATILVAEDERSILNLIATTLSTDGYHLLKASSGSEALRMVAAHAGPIDLVLTDAMMPGMSGIELARTLLRTHPAVPVIVMSGYAHILSGVDLDGLSISILHKPFTSKTLRGLVRNALVKPEPDPVSPDRGATA